MIVLGALLAHELLTHALGERLQRRESLNTTLLWRSCIHELPVMEGALIPVLVLLVAWATGFTVDSGARVALWSAAVSIVVLEVVAGWRSRLSPRGLSLQAGAGAVMGLTLVGLKLVLHSEPGTAPAQPLPGVREPLSHEQSTSKLTFGDASGDEGRRRLVVDDRSEA